MAANIFQVGGGGNWGTVGSWSLGAVPTAGDGNTATFNGTSPACTVNTSNRVCNSIDFTGYTANIAMTFNIAVSGSITLDPTAGMTVSGTGKLQSAASGTITPNAFSWPNTYEVTTAATVTLADNFQVATFIHTGTTTLNGAFNLLCTNLSGSGTVSGSAAIVMNGIIGATTGNTGTWNSTGNVQVNLTFNSPGTINVSNGTIFAGTKTLTYTAGNMVCTGTTQFISGTSTTTVNSGNMLWNNITVASNSSTLALGSDLNVVGNFSSSLTSNNLSVTGAFNINVGGNLAFASVTSGLFTSGTATIQMTSNTILGTAFSANCALSMNASVTTGGNSLPIVFNKSGTITWSSSFQQSGRTITYTAGTQTLASTAGTVLTLIGTNCTIAVNVAGIQFTALTTSLTGTLTLSGSQGLLFTSFTNVTAGSTITLQSTNTYNLTNMTVVGTRSNAITMQASTGASQALWILATGGTIEVARVAATDINSNGGRTIWDFGTNTLSNTANWKTFLYPSTVSSAILG